MLKTHPDSRIPKECMSCDHRLLTTVEGYSTKHTVCLLQEADPLDVWTAMVDGVPRTTCEIAFLRFSKCPKSGVKTLSATECKHRKASQVAEPFCWEGEPVGSEAPAVVSAVQDLMKTPQPLRRVVFSYFCTRCGSEDPNCKCG